MEVFNVYLLALKIHDCIFLKLQLLRLHPLYKNYTSIGLIEQVEYNIDPPTLVIAIALSKI